MSAHASGDRILGTYLGETRSGNIVKSWLQPKPRLSLQQISPLDIQWWGGWWVQNLLNSIPSTISILISHLPRVLSLLSFDNKQHYGAHQAGEMDEEDMDAEVELVEVEAVPRAGTLGAGEVRAEAVRRTLARAGAECTLLSACLQRLAGQADAIKAAARLSRAGAISGPCLTCCAPPSSLASHVNLSSQEDKALEGMGYEGWDRVRSDPATVRVLTNAAPLRAMTSCK